MRVQKMAMTVDDGIESAFTLLSGCALIDGKFWRVLFDFTVPGSAVTGILRPTKLTDPAFAGSVSPHHHFSGKSWGSMS